MNKVILIGRLTKDVEVRQGETAFCRFSLAVDRRREGVDFINCVAFGKTAEFIGKYFSKGKKMGATGRIQTGSYTNRDGKKQYSCDIVVEEVEFVEPKSSQSDTAPVGDGFTPAEDEFVPVADDLNDDGLPFN